MKLKSIKEEEEDCRKAFANSKIGDPVNFCHHEYPLEILSDPAKNRIDYILEAKTDNVALRLRLFRPAKLPAGDAKFDKALAVCDKAWANYDKAWAACDKAWAVCDKAWAACYKAWDAYDKAGDAYDKAWDACNKAYLPHFKELFGVEWKGSIFETFGEEE